MQHKSDMVEIIFSATERLMAKYGLHHLSMHKIAKEAGISAGTIYIHFENKDALLNKLAQHIFDRFHDALLANFNLEDNFYTQYHRFWWNLWDELQKRPEVVLNLHQYKSLPGFGDLVQEYLTNPNNPWNLFCNKGIAQQILCPLPTDILFSISLDSAMNLAIKAIHTGKNYSQDILEQVVHQTWCAIQNLT